MECFKGGFAYARRKILRAYNIIDTPKEKAFDDLAKLAAQICEVPVSLITFVDGNRQWFKAVVGIDLTENDYETSFGKIALETEGLLTIPDARLDSRFSSHPAVTEDGIVFYAGIRLMGPDQVPLGTLCVLDRKLRTLSQRQEAALLQLADQVISQLELRRNLRRLQVERELQLQLFEALPALITYWDKDLVLKFANQRFQDWICGDNIKPSRLIGKRLDQVFTRKLIQEHEKLIGEVLQGTTHSFDEVIVRPNKKSSCWRFTLVPELKEEEVAGFFALAVDLTEQKLAEEDAVRSQERLRNVIDNMPALIGYWSADLKNEFANRRYLEALGLDQETIRAMPIREAMGEELFEQCQPYLKRVLAGKPQTFDRTSIGPTGKVTHVQSSFIPDLVKGRVQGFYALEADITDRRAAEISLQEEQERGRVTLNSIGDGVITTDCQGLVTYLNPKAEKMTGWGLGDAKGAPLQAVLKMQEGLKPLEFCDPLERAARRAKDPLTPVICRVVNRAGEEFSVKDSASPILDAHSEAVGTVLVLHDVSEERAMASRMAHLARHDSLTNLPNRMLLMERMAVAIEHCDQVQDPESPRQFAVMFLNVDYFKNINDSMVHEVGDALLRAVSERLKESVKASDTVSRLGGDEFIVLINGIESSEHAGFLAQQLVRTLSAPYQIETPDGRHFKLSITISAGVAIYPSDGADRDTLIRRADVAMYLAKQAGRNRYQLFTPELDQEVIVRHSWLQDIREALDKNEFRVFYQPKVSTKDRGIVGVEALVRWQKSTGEMVPPNEFVPLAEKSGLIVEIGAQVLYEACRQWARWESLGLVTLPVAVNVSAVQLASPGFVEFVAKVVKDTKINPRHLELEITESSLMADVDKAANVLFQLKELGVKISLDDFGTGYSSLSYLRRFPLDCIKIDRSFVSDLTTNASTAAIMKTICNLGRTLNLSIVAEGVETEAQAQLICSLNCDAMQGYLFSKPVRAETITQILPYESVFRPKAA